MSLPTPYWQSACGRYTLYHGDCLSILPHLSGVDSIVTDPPYGVSLGEHASAGETRSGLLVKKGGYDDSPERFERVVVPAVLLAISKSSRAMVFGVPPHIWKFPAPDAIGGIFVPGAVGRNRWGWSNLIHCLMYGTAASLQEGARPTAFSNNDTAEHTGHPTTKPTRWMRWAVELGSNENEVVCDPFTGSGTTGVACVKANRRFIGIEIEERYCAIARRRIEEEANHLFAQRTTP